jgi:ComF family protein
VSRLDPGRCVFCGRFPAGGSPTAASHACVAAHARYSPPLPTVLLHLKYRPSDPLARLLGSWLAEGVVKQGVEPDLVVPVPLGKGRMARRGYNQVELLARAVADELHVPFSSGGLWRLRDTRSQVGLSARLRQANVHGAFQADPQQVRGKLVVVVDDLVTTGATLAECRRALLGAGAQQVRSFAVGRA